MNLYFHFSVAGFANTYLIGPDDGGDAILVDPGSMNIALLNLIESNNYSVKHVLLTHTHGSHVEGIKTLSRIYDFKIYAESKTVLGFECVRITGGSSIDIAGFTVHFYAMHGHSSDSMVYGIERCLFTGDILGAGTIGATPNGYARELLISEIRNKVLSREDDLIIFPGHGAPTTIEAERLTNPVFAVPR